VIVGESDDFRTFAPLGGPNREAFSCPVKEASMKASSSCSFPRACNSSARHMQDAFQLALKHPLLKTAAAVAGLVRWVFPRQLAPLRSGTQNPRDSVEHRSQCPANGRPRPSERRFGR
jgi:hypothetical protein